MNKITKQCVAAVASLAMAGTLCVAGAVVAGSSAWAETTPEKAPWDTTLDANKKGSINIIKWKYALNAQGNQEKAEKVPGAEFTVTKVKKFNSSDTAELNLKSYDDWMKVAAKVSALNTNPNDTNLVLGTPKKVSTADKTESGKVKGEAKFSDLEIGLYKVEETKTPAGYAGLSSPFFMTIPEVTSADGKTNTYKYDVQVEPKNKLTDIKKKVDTTGTVGAGDEVPYTITTDVTTTTTNTPDKYTKDDLQGFAVWDDALISAYSDVTANLSNENAKALVKEVKIGTTDITNSTSKTNYNVSVEQNSTTNAKGPESVRARIKVTFTEDGLTAIADAIKTAYTNNKAQLPQLTVKFTFKIAPDAPTGDFYNKYGFQPGHGAGGKTPDPVNPPDNNPDTKVTLVKFQIKKVNGVKEDEALSGAKFAVFAKKSDADTCAADKNRSAANCKDKATKGYTTGTTVADGLDGATNGTADGTGLTGAFEVKVGDVYVVETQAPTGFVLSPKVEKVTVQQSGTEYNATNTTFTYTFKDLPNGGPDGSGKNWFNLPATGAAGVIIFALIGLGLVGSGMFVFLKNRKKEEEQAA
ncbi:SpaH/EbpB family LPXTG-anchored major pilin [Gardnerella pickettii]|uniref:SpaH/EbpB family LPXTG-anchored major pilin n=1 Tax=Gardnerella pickettii TaxID=2914924 RepID=UPI0039EEBB3F